MGPARFHCATLLPYEKMENLEYVECNQSVNRIRNRAKRNSISFSRLRWLL